MKNNNLLTTAMISILLSACGGGENSTPSDPLDSAFFEFLPLSAPESEEMIIQTGTCMLMQNGNSDAVVPTCEGGILIGATIVRSIENPDFVDIPDEFVFTEYSPTTGIVDQEFLEQTRECSIQINRAEDSPPLDCSTQEVSRTFPNPAFIVPRPPFSGTIGLDPNIITSSDQTTFVSSSFVGVGSRMVFDRRVNSFITIDAFLFNSLYDDGRMVEVQVNPEFGSPEEAQIESNLYSEIIGRLPSVLLNDLETVWIHRGIELFGGGNNNILIHTDQAVIYTNDGVLEETLVHEASHTSLDASHASASGWLSAQTEDNTFISTYARDNPIREDIAETFLVYLAIRYRSDRIPALLEQTILETVPNRIDYFDAQAFNVHPIQ